MEKNILIIEDDKDIREGVKILLEGEGYSVEEASNGADGLKKLTSHTNLVILDIMMPGISGLKTCEEIRKISYVPILFLTAKSKESDKLIGFMAGADDYLIKPFNIERINHTLERIERMISKDSITYPGHAPEEMEKKRYGKACFSDRP